MDIFKSQIIHVVNTVDKLDLQDRLEALSYLQKITEAYTNKSLSLNTNLESAVKTNLIEPTLKIVKHKCKNRFCLVYNIKHLKKIMCFKCDKRAENEFQLFEHLQTHLDYPLSCILCHCSFRNVEDYNSHKLTDCKPTSKENSSNYQKYVCTVCHTSFATKKTFQSHLLISHGTKLYNNWYGCKLCHQMFEQKKMLYHHYKDIHSDSKFPWEIKKKRDVLPSFQSLNADKSNMAENEEPEKFECLHCGRCFIRKSILSVHMKRHLQKQEFSCTLCKKTFNKFKNYKRHFQTVTHQNKVGSENHPLFKCEPCNKVFSSRDALSRHNLRKHAPEDRQLKCPLCDFKTTLSVSLSRHVNLHTDNRKFICDQCGSCFHTQSALKEHTAYVHSNERNYSCEICGQRFKLKSGLNRHLKTHSDEKEFKCFCGQLFKFRTNLKRHIVRTHKMGNKKTGVLRVTAEEPGYAINSPKAVQRSNKVTKQQKQQQQPLQQQQQLQKEELDESSDGSRLDCFDISSLAALSEVDLSCADEVLRETYDNLSKYAVENGESQESLNSILAPVNHLIDRVLQETAVARLKQQTTVAPADKYPTTSSLAAAATSPLGTTDTSMAAGVTASNPMLNTTSPYRASCSVGSCRQYAVAATTTTPTFADFTAAVDQYSQAVPKMDAAVVAAAMANNQYSNLGFDSANLICDAFNRQYLPEIQVEDDSSFSYTKWLNEIL